MGIPGRDLIGEGEHLKGRITLVAGTAGSAKSVAAEQSLAEWIKSGGLCGLV